MPSDKYASLEARFSGRPRALALLRELFEVLSEDVEFKGTIEIPLEGFYSSRLIKEVLQVMGFETAAKKIYNRHFIKVRARVQKKK